MEKDKQIYSRSDQEMSLKDFIISIQRWCNYLVSKWYIILTITLVGGAAGYFYASTSTSNYIATTTFVLEGKDGGGLSRYAGMAAMVGVDLSSSGGGIFQGDNIFELYKSRTMLAKTLLTKVHEDSEELLIQRYIRINGFKDKWEEDERGDLLTLDFKNEYPLDSSQNRLRDSLIGVFTSNINRHNLNVGKSDKTTSIIEVEVVSSDELFSKVFNQELVSHVNTFYAQTKTSRTLNNITVLQQKIDSVRSVLKGSIFSGAQAIDATPNLNPTRQVQRTAPATQAQISSETNKAILGQLVQNLEMSKMTLLEEQPLIQVVDEPVYPLPVKSFGIIKGVVIGCFMFSILCVVFLLFIRFYKDIMSN